MSSRATAGARDSARMAAFRRAAPMPLGIARRRERQDDGNPPDSGRAARDAPVPASSVQGTLDREAASAGARGGRARLHPALPPDSGRAAHMAAGRAGGGGTPDERPRRGRGHRGARIRDPGADEPRAALRGGLAA